MNIRTIPYHRLTKRLRASMLRDAAALSARVNPDYQMTWQQVRWLMFMRGEK
jgi:hypothetical protein